MQLHYANDLGNRLIKCKKFNWLDGMLVKNTHDFLEKSRIIGFTNNAWLLKDTHSQSLHKDLNHFIPDVNDPATIGCLISLTRKAYNNPYLYIESSLQDHKKHFWLINNEYKTFKSLEEAETIVLALEAVT